MLCSSAASIAIYAHEKDIYTASVFVLWERALPADVQISPLTLPKAPFLNAIATADYPAIENSEEKVVRMSFATLQIDQNFTQVV